MTVTQIDSLQHSSPEMEKSQLRRLGFIDEALVQEMVIRNVYQRRSVNTEQMALSSSEDDYAGWNLPPSASFGQAA
jgi:hypothetical protein